MVGAWVDPRVVPLLSRQFLPRNIPDVLEEPTIELGIPTVVRMTHLNVWVSSNIVVSVQFVEEETEVAQDAQNK